MDATRDYQTTNATSNNNQKEKERQKHITMWLNRMLLIKKLAFKVFSGLRKFNRHHHAITQKGKSAMLNYNIKNPGWKLHMNIQCYTPCELHAQHYHHDVLFSKTSRHVHHLKSTWRWGSVSVCRMASSFSYIKRDPMHA